MQQLEDFVMSSVTHSPRAILDSVHLYPIAQHADQRGTLHVVEYPTQVPFKIERFFYIEGVSPNDQRGQHGHRTCHQYLICMRGSCKVSVNNGAKEEHIVLDSPAMGLHIAPLTWIVMQNFSADALLLVAASEPYHQSEYIYDFAELKALRHK